jgi:hypothetical protein
MISPRAGRSKLLPELVIALSLCLGGHFMIVDPIKQKLRDTQMKVNQLVDESREAGRLGDDLPRVVQILSQTAVAAQSIHERSRDALDEGAMFTAITTLAVRHNVRIDQLDPREAPDQPGRAPSPAPGAPAAPAPRPGDHVLAYTITATARYADLTAFVEALTTGLGYTVVHSLRIEPTYDPAMPTILATIVTEHYAFDASPLAITSAAPGAPPPTSP